MTFRYFSDGCGGPATGLARVRVDESASTAEFYAAPAWRWQVVTNTWKRSGTVQADVLGTGDWERIPGDRVGKVMNEIRRAYGVEVSSA